MARQNVYYRQIKVLLWCVRVVREVFGGFDITKGENIFNEFSYVLRNGERGCHSELLSQAHQGCPFVLWLLADSPSARQLTG